MKNLTADLIKQEKFREETQHKINILFAKHKKATRKLVDALEKNIDNPKFVLDSIEYYNLQNDLRDFAKQIEIEEQKFAWGEEEYNNQLNSF